MVPNGHNSRHALMTRLAVCRVLPPITTSRGAVGKLKQITSSPVLPIAQTASLNMAIRLYAGQRTSAPQAAYIRGSQVRNRLSLFLHSSTSTLSDHQSFFISRSCQLLHFRKKTTFFFVYRSQYFHQNAFFQASSCGSRRHAGQRSIICHSQLRCESICSM